jgi:AcrR family transcriptional regulator
MKTASKEKRGRPMDESVRATRADEILDAAAVVFARHGYQDTEMQYIADALQVAKGTLYRYFASKEELFLKAVMRGMQRLREEVQASGVGVDDPLELLTKAIYAYLAFFRNHPQYTELLIQERAQFKDRKQQTYFVHREKNIGRWRDMYLGLIAEGRLRNMPVERILDVLNDLVYGTMFTNYFTERHKPLESQAHDLVDIIFHGILSDSERRRHPAG